jgi:thiamine-monophosphate kinase
MVSSEFDLIERFFRRPPGRPGVVCGIGDDAAVLRPPPDRDLVVTVDTLIEGVHFPPATPAFDIGYKALAVNLSDLAAMGAAPAWATLALTLPRADEGWLEGFRDGFFALARRYEIDLVGGDTTRGGLSITVQAMGTTPPSAALTRGGARVGERIYVTGTLGDAALALRALAGDVDLPPAELERCLGRLNRPQPRVEAGLALQGLASAAIDVSDGVLADLRHILTASGVGAMLELERLPLSAPVRRALATGEADWSLPLSGGDDYELAFTVAARGEPRLRERFHDLGCPVSRIGTVQPEPGLRAVLDGVIQVLPGQGGYDHFGG